MTYVDTWGEWIAWPLRRLFNRRAARAEFEMSLQSWIYGFETTPQMSRAEAIERERRLQTDTQAADRRNEMTASLASRFEIVTQLNLDALQERARRFGSIPTEVVVFERGRERTLTIPARPNTGEVQAFERICSHLSRRESSTKSGSPELRLAK